MSDKVIAIVDKPKDCEKCVFSGCKYSMPLSTNRKGYYCNLKEPKDITIEDFFYTDEVHLKNCPLISVDNYDKEIRDKAIGEAIQKVKEMYAFTILEEQQLDEIEEQMKEVER